MSLKWTNTWNFEIYVKIQYNLLLTTIYNSTIVHIMVRKLYTIHYNSEINVGGLKKKQEKNIVNITEVGDNCTQSLN